MLLATSESRNACSAALRPVACDVPGPHLLPNFGAPNFAAPGLGTPNLGAKAAGLGGAGELPSPWLSPDSEFRWDAEDRKLR